jgi:undecaprenyl-diphosphatase
MNFAWLLSGFLFIALTIPPLRTIINDVDGAFHRISVDTEWQPLVTAAEALDVIGSVWVTFPFIGLIAVWLVVQKHWEAMFTWFLTMGLTQVLIGPIKNLYERARPPDALVETTSFSFPSGHAVAGAAIAVAAVIVLVPAGPARRNLEMLAAGFAVAMALSRVYLRAHYLSDVAAGAALGIAVAVGTASLLHEIDNRRRVHQGEEREP